MRKQKEFEKMDEESLLKVGKATPAIDSVEKVTGSTKYCSDLSLPGMLFGRVKRSPFPHAKILAIDMSKAEKLPGVRAVITSKDLPPKRHGYGLLDEHSLVHEKVRYVGEPVAAVAADTVEIAEKALDLIEVKYEELPAVFDPEEAMKPEPPAIIHEDLPNYETSFDLPKLDVPRPNVLAYSTISGGDIEKGFEEADFIVENRFETSTAQHCPLEPHNAMARVEPDGGVTIWRDIQKPYLLRDQISRMFGIPPSKVRIIVPPIGGGFGNKGEVKMEGICVALAQKTGKPVRISYTREEVFIGTSVRHSCIITIRDGVKRDGRITAREIKLIWNAGAYAAESIPVSRAGAASATATYRIPNFKLESYCVYTNTPISGAFRGFGVPQVQFAVESQMDLIARKLGIDPVEFRMIHALDEGDETVLGDKLHSVGAKECLQKVAETLEWRKECEKEYKKNGGIWRRGKGVALVNKYTITSPSAAIVKVYPPPWRAGSDITVEVRSSAVNIGQGVTTVLAQIAAEEFKIPLERVTVAGVDTAVTPFDMGTVSSRETFHAGNAVRLACQDAKRQIFQIAAQKIQVDSKDLETEGGMVYIKGTASKSIPISELFTTYSPIGSYIAGEGEIIGKAAFQSGAAAGVWGKVGRGMAAYYTFSACGVDLEVNMETGDVRVLKIVEAVEVGKAINPMAVRGQIYGGLVMGLSTTLFEKMIVQNGKVANADFTDYKIIRAADLPPSEMAIPIILENAPHREGPFGAKGLGELTIVALAPAIANAIHDASSIRITEIPITHEKIQAHFGDASENISIHIKPR